MTDVKIDELLVELEGLAESWRRNSYGSDEYLSYFDARGAHNTHQAATTIRELRAENERLREALERMLLEFEFMWEDGTLPDRRDDIIFVAARAALEQKS